MSEVKKDKGILFWKRRWFSICSMHRRYDPDCNCCNAGHWVNLWGLGISQLFFKISPRLWRWWMNRPNSKARKRLKQWFPNLK